MLVSVTFEIVMEAAQAAQGLHHLVDHLHHHLCLH